MPNCQRGFAHILVILVLLAGLAASVYLVQQRTNFFPHAESQPISPPITPIPSTTPGACTACAADMDKDGYVTITDFSKFRMCFGLSATDKDSSGNSCALADFNKDGYVTIVDFSCLRSVFGQPCKTPIPMPTAIPTPTPVIACNKDVSFSTAQSGNQINFKINGDASTYIGDDYGGGVKPETCTGIWNDRSCQMTSPGNYAWTHTWRHCVGSFDNCSPICSTIAIKYSTTAVPTPIPPKTTTSLFVCSACAADINQDGTVSITDFTKLAGCYNKPVAGDCATADINKDGAINSKDLSCLMSQFGKKCSR